MHFKMCGPSVQLICLLYKKHLRSIWEYAEKYCFFFCCIFCCFGDIIFYLCEFHTKNVNYPNRKLWTKCDRFCRFAVIHSWLIGVLIVTYTLGKIYLFKFINENNAVNQNGTVYVLAESQLRGLYIVHKMTISISI